MARVGKGYPIRGRLKRAIISGKKYGEEIQGSHQSKLFVEPHLVSQHRAIVEQVWLHVAPHVGEPPELFAVFQQHVVPCVLLLCPSMIELAREAQVEGEIGD